MSMGLADLVFPAICASCGSLGPKICTNCLKKARPIEKDWCLSCGNEVETVAPCVRCFDTNDKPRVISLWYYETTISRAIWSLKYKSNASIVTDLFHLATPEAIGRVFCGLGQYTNPVFLPIPLHKEKERERGYNQALLIAKALEIFTGVTIEDSAICRVRKTQPQAHCKSRTQRAANIHGAFHMTNPERLRGRTAILVDDVITTGETAQEVVRVLKKHRLSAPQLICLAREKIE